MANRFNTFMDAWMLHRVCGLPLRMIFLCSWHRVHGAVIAVGIGVVGIGALIRKPPISFVGAFIAAPSMLCLLMLPVLGVLFIGLEKLFDDRTGVETSIEFPADTLTTSAHVTQISARLYRLDSVPLFTELASFGDIIEADPIADGVIRFCQVIEPSNWRVFDFVLPKTMVESETLKQVLAHADRVGAHWENVFGGVVYICVPPGVDWDPTPELTGQSSVPDVPGGGQEL